MHELFGYAGAIVCLGAAVVYLVAIIQGRVHSNRVTWGVWVVVTLMIAFGYWQANGWVASLWVPIAYALTTFLTFVALLLFGKKGEWSWVEKFGFIGSAVVIILWIYFHSGYVGLMLTLVIDVIGAVMLVESLYWNETQEYALSWWMGFLGNVLNLWAVERWTYAEGIYPVYMVLLTGVVSLLAQFPSLRSGKGRNNG